MKQIMNKGRNKDFFPLAFSLLWEIENERLISRLRFFCSFFQLNISAEAFSQFYQHFTSNFCVDILLPKNYKSQTLLEKSFSKQFHTKRAIVKYWWNWHLVLISQTFYKQLLRWYSFAKNYKIQTVLEKSCIKHFCTKKGWVKCWWNKHLGLISSTFYK